MVQATSIHRGGTERPGCIAELIKSEQPVDNFVDKGRITSGQIRKPWPDVPGLSLCTMNSIGLIEDGCPLPGDLWDRH
jgi:hypothetical protein